MALAATPFAGSKLGAAPAPEAKPTDIRIGIIGLGKMGRYHLDKLAKAARVVALCDVHQTRLYEAGESVGFKVASFADHRQLLEFKDVDAVVVATPDHWHAQMTMDACDAGKDVYVETPAATNPADGRKMVEAARQNERVVQVGAHGRANVGARKACEYLRNGSIGNIQRVVCWNLTNPPGKPWAAVDPPAELNWREWLGPLESRPYTEDLFQNWRNHLAIGGGQLCGTGALVLSLASWIMEADDCGPVRVEAKGSEPDPVTGCPVEFEVSWKFENPDWKLVWQQPGKQVGKLDHGAVYHGRNGTLNVYGGGDGVGTEQKAWDWKPGPADKNVPFSPGHLANWLECIRSRQRPLMDIEAGHRVATLCHLGNLAWQQGRALQWDWRDERIAIG